MGLPLSKAALLINMEMSPGENTMRAFTEEDKIYVLQMLHEKYRAFSEQWERAKGLQSKTKKGGKSYKTDSFGLRNTPETVLERLK